MRKKLTPDIPLFPLAGILCLFLLGLFSSGCSCSRKYSYPDKNLEKNLHDLLMKESGIDTLVKRNGDTLGICFTVPKLYGSGRKTMPIVVDQFQDVMLCVRRVLMSTDSSVQFFQITVRGNDSGLEISMTRYVKDLKIFFLSCISLDDYSKRMVNNTYINLASQGKERIQRFFEDWGTKKPEALAAAHFTQGIFKNQDISSGFIASLWETTMKLNVKHEILDLRMRAADDKTYLFFCRVRETFDKKQGFQNFTFRNYSGMTQDFLIEISSVDYFRTLITKLYIKGEENTQWEYQKIEQTYGDPEQWRESDFFVINMNFKRFLAEQIAERIQIILGNREKEEKTKTSFLPRLSEIRGSFEDGTIKLLFIYSDFKKDVDTEDKNVAMETTKNVFELYRYRECKSVMIGTLTGSLSTYPIG
ncbi:MAG: hypothetical protein JW774_12815 [Candidatus Aureabacteria bacterium]|nr:hypothetical protein [Candidatus Auribacterota bacterium]